VEGLLEVGDGVVVVVRLVVGVSSEGLLDFERRRNWVGLGAVRREDIVGCCVRG